MYEHSLTQCVRKARSQASVTLIVLETHDGAGHSSYSESANRFNPRSRAITSR